MQNTEKLYQIAYHLQYKSIKFEKEKRLLLAYLIYKFIIDNFENTTEGKYSKSQIENIKEAKDFSFSEDKITEELKNEALMILNAEGFDIEDLSKKYSTIKKKEEYTKILHEENYRSYDQNEFYKDVRTIKNILLYFFFLSIISIIIGLILLSN